MIEFEVRGKIENREDFNIAVEIMKSKAKLIEERRRFTITYFKQEVTPDVRSIKDEKVDLRLRITDKKAEIILKYGNWGAKDRREEISIPISIKDFDKAVELLRNIGWNHGILTKTKTFVFDYKGIEFALVEQNSRNFYFEAERTSEDDKDAQKIHEEIEKACAELNLKPHTEEGFLDFMNELNETNIKFNFLKENWQDYRPGFAEFF